MGHSSAAPVHVGAQDLESLVKAHASNGLPASRTQEERQMTTEIATFGAGCFWGIEAAFSRIPGVTEAVSGYSGGRTENERGGKDNIHGETFHAFTH